MEFFESTKTFRKEKIGLEQNLLPIMSLDTLIMFFKGKWTLNLGHPKKEWTLNLGQSEYLKQKKWKKNTTNAVSLQLDNRTKERRQNARDKDKTKTEKINANKRSLKGSIRIQPSIAKKKLQQPTLFNMTYIYIQFVSTYILLFICIYIMPLSLMHNKL